MKIVVGSSVWTLVIEGLWQFARKLNIQQVNMNQNQERMRSWK